MDNEQEILRRRDACDEYEETDEPPLPPAGSNSTGQLHTPAPKAKEHRGAPSAIPPSEPSPESCGSHAGRWSEPLQIWSELVC